MDDIEQHEKRDFNKTINWFNKIYLKKKRKSYIEQGKKRDLDKGIYFLLRSEQYFLFRFFCKIFKSSISAELWGGFHLSACQCHWLH